MHKHLAAPAAAPDCPRAHAMRQAVERICAAGIMPSALCADAQALCDAVEAGSVPADQAAEEIRALLGGIALRAQGVGQPCCQIADALLTDLAATAGVPWGGCAVPGGEDRANGRTGLVELRFPAADIWAVPAVAHEMGHVIARAPQLGPKAGSGNPARRVIDEGLPAPQREELFCDFYATYVMGPAFPAYMVLERLDPSRAAPDRPFPDKDQAAATHPTPDKRVLLMLQTLALLDEAMPLAAPLTGARKFLASAWAERLAGASRADRVDQDATTVVQHLARRLWAELDPVLRCGFTTTMAARTLAGDFRAGKTLTPAPGVRVLDVVAAAWMARIAGPPRAGPALSGLAERALSAAHSAATPHNHE